METPVKFELPGDRSTASNCTPAALAAHAQELAARADALAAEIAALHRDNLAAGSEPVRRTGYRCDTASGWVRESAGYLREMAADLGRIEAAAAPGVCAVSWGVCPEHGNTLTCSGGRTWCRLAGCCGTWDYDRAGLPCSEPARWSVRDQHGGSSAMCDGHAFDAARCIDGAQVAPQPATVRRESA
jgi:hypothetical protein